MNKITLILTIAIAAVFSACNSDKIIEEHKDLSPNIEWKKDLVIEWKATIEDAALTYDMSLALRFITGIPYKDVKVELETISPSGVVTKELFPINVKLSATQLNGECMGDYCDLTVPVKSKVKFLETGVYTFKARQAMPFPIITHVMELGLIIEKAKI